MITKLNPPYIENTLSAFTSVVHDNGLKTTELLVPFRHNPTVAFSSTIGMRAIIKAVQDDTLVADVATYWEQKILDENSEISVSIDPATTGGVKFDLSNYQYRLIVGNSYKVQIAYIYLNNGTEMIGYYSSVGVVKYTTKPITSLEKLEQSTGLKYRFHYIQEDKTEYFAYYDTTEKLYSTVFEIWEGQSLIATSGEILHNTNTDIDKEQIEEYEFDILDLFSQYTCKVTYRTINNFIGTEELISVVEEQPIRLISYNKDPNGTELSSGYTFSIVNNYYDGSLELLGMKEKKMINSELLLPDVEPQDHFLEFNQFYCSNTNSGPWVKIIKNQKDYLIPFGQKKYYRALANYCGYYKCWPSNLRGLRTRRDLEIDDNQNLNILDIYTTQKPKAIELEKQENGFYYYNVFKGKFTVIAKSNKIKYDCNSFYLAFDGKERNVVKLLAEGIQENGSTFSIELFRSPGNNIPIWENDYPYILFSSFYNITESTALFPFLFKPSTTKAPLIRFYSINSSEDAPYLSSVFNKIIFYQDSEEGKVCYFEDTFLYDGEKQLTIKYNPEVNSFKQQVLETKIDTIGGKYPIIYRNGTVSYKTFNISGLISCEMDIDNFFQEPNNRYTSGSRSEADLRQDFIPAIQHNNLTDENFKRELDFKMKVLEWLNNGKPKLFRSPAEGNCLVQLTNISLTPVKELGRMLHTFTATAYEIGDCDTKTLKRYGIIKED